MARSGMRAFEHSDTLSDEQLHERDRAIAMHNHAKTLQLAHMWFPAGMAVNVGVKVDVATPSETERLEMRALDEKLDSLAAKVKALPLPA